MEEEAFHFFIEGADLRYINPTNAECIDGSCTIKLDISVDVPYFGDIYETADVYVRLNKSIE